MELKVTNARIAGDWLDSASEWARSAGGAKVSSNLNTFPGTFPKNT